jgi:hypothetical protein
MKTLIIPVPLFLIPVCQWLGIHLPLIPAAIIAFILMFAASFTSLYILHTIIFGHRPRFW